MTETVATVALLTLLVLALTPWTQLGNKAIWALAILTPATTIGVVALVVWALTWEPPALHIGAP